ncbi:MAG: methionine--tRNA ligase [Fimbriimonadaceae bacterium]|nr:methionine--tRNA ligase [Fimbriimonadaceae bacterium]
MSIKRYLVTSALPYANGPIHIGHVAGAYLPADIYVRYLRAKGREVIYICGSDEYGTAITETARKLGQTPLEVADRFHAVIRDGFAKLGISFDNFSRTTRPVHTAITQEFFLKLYHQGLLETRTTEQLFDPEVGKFLADRQIRGTCNYCGHLDAAGDQCEKCGKAIDPLELIAPRSALSGAALERRETTHYYFPFEQFQPWLSDYIHSREGWRPQVVGFCQGYFGEGLRARPVTRDLDWGIPVPLPGHEGKVLYVWFDAPIGYISSTKEWAEQSGQPEKWREYWGDHEGTKLVHFIGKDNTIFHALLFPAWCHAHGDYVVATDVPANEFLNLEGQKFSTSRNHAIWLHEVLERWPADYLRYYLATILPETADSDWKWADFKERINSELNDNLGNFAQRTVKFIAQYLDGQVPPLGPLTAADQELLDRTAALAGEVGALLEAYEFKRAIRHLFSLGTAANGYFQQQQPWKLKADRERCGTVLAVCAQVCRALAVCCAPFLPAAAQALWCRLGQSGQVIDQPWDAAAAPLPVGQALPPDPQPIFWKVSDEQIAAEVARLGAPAPEPAMSEPTPATPEPPAAPPAVAAPEGVALVTYEQFRATQLRTATVTAAERIPKADKLLKLQLDVGGQPRQILAGIAPWFEPEALVGQTIIIVANLEPRKLRGEVSEGMLLAATADDVPVLLTTARPVPSGLEVR